MTRTAALETAFKDLFSQEYERLCRYALTYVQDAHIAEDVVQDTFIKIWEKKKELVETPSIRFYLITAVKNNCISHIRKLRSKPVYYTDEIHEPEPEPFFNASQERERESEQTKKITEALNNLPPKCKEIFLLIKLHGMSYKQAAETLELSIKTIENQMGKAIKILKDICLANSVVFFTVLMMYKGIACLNSIPF